MKKHSLYLLSLLLMLGCAPKETKTREINMVPMPASIKHVAGTVTWKSSVTIVAPGVEEQKAGTFLAEFLKARGLEASSAATASSSADQVIFSITNDSTLAEEGYLLTINKEGAHVTARTGAGLFYGVQSLFQLIPVSGEVELPLVDIADQPRFTWRGLHLDVGRHFFPVDFIKKYIDLMSHYKLNTFHWHLTEDQGWRIEIKKYPKLQEVAAFRKETLVGHLGGKNEPGKYDGIKHGGFYTQDQIREVVAYAAERHITVVPEIEMPGHAQAALAAYPYLGCTGGPYEVATHWGVFYDVFCGGKETTFQFLQDVIDEIVPLFPGKYIHIGGDECPKDRWKKCQFCQKRMKTEKLKDEHELQSYFIQRMEKYINSKGKQIIGWDEILEGGLAPNAAVMSWRGEKGGIAAAEQNHNVVMTPTDWLYFDYYQDTASHTEPLSIGGFVPLSKVYSYEPVSSQLTSDQANHILGTQANVWSEYMPTTTQVEYMVYPRALALSEIAWSPKGTKDYDAFVKRIRANQGLLELWKVNYAKHVFK